MNDRDDEQWDPAVEVSADVPNAKVLAYLNLALVNRENRDFSLWPVRHCAIPLRRTTLANPR
jgi:hypothetical protein